MPTPAFGEFDRVAVRIMHAHRALPRLFMRRLEKFNPSAFQSFVQSIKIISGQFNVDAGSLLWRCALRSEKIVS